MKSRLTNPEEIEIAQAMVPDEDLEKMMMHEIQFNHGLIKDGSDSIMPRLVIYSKKDLRSDYEVIVCGFADPEFNDKKQEMVEAVGMKMALEHKINPVLLTFASEAWVRVIEKGTAKEEEWKKSGKRVSDYDDKTECIIVAGLTIDGREKAAVLNVDRNDKGDFNPKDITFMDDVESYILKKFYIGYTKALMAKGKL